MKPLLAKDVAAFMQRFDNFRDGEVRSVKIISPTQMQVTLAGQDNARAFDWITITFEFNNIRDARLLEESKLHLIDMSEGITCLYEESSFAFGIGQSYDMSSIKNTTSYIISENLKYQEGLF